MRTLEVPADRMIQLPKSLFKPAEKVALLTEGDVLIVKKLESPRLSSIATRVKERPLPMRDILQEIRAYRRAKRVR